MRRAHASRRATISRFSLLLGCPPYQIFKVAFITLRGFKVRSYSSLCGVDNFTSNRRYLEICNHPIQTVEYSAGSR